MNAGSSVEYRVTSVICPIHGEWTPTSGSHGVSPERVTASFLKHNRVLCGRCTDDGVVTRMLVNVEPISDQNV